MVQIGFKKILVYYIIININMSAEPKQLPVISPKQSNNKHANILNLNDFYSASLYKVYIKMILTHMTMNRSDYDTCQTKLDALKKLIQQLKTDQKFKIPSNLIDHPLSDKKYFSELEIVNYDHNHSPNLNSTEYDDKFFNDRNKKLAENLKKISTIYKQSSFDTYIKENFASKENDAVIAISFLLSSKIEDYIYNMDISTPEPIDKEASNNKTVSKDNIVQNLINDIHPEYNINVQKIMTNDTFNIILHKLLSHQNNMHNIVKHMDLLREISRIKTTNQVNLINFQLYLKYNVLEESLMQLLNYIKIYHSVNIDSKLTEYNPIITYDDSLINNINEYITNEHNIQTGKFDINPERYNNRQIIIAGIKKYATSLSDNDKNKILLTGVLKLFDTIHESFYNIPNRTEKIKPE